MKQVQKARGVAKKSPVLEINYSETLRSMQVGETSLFPRDVYLETRIRSAAGAINLKGEIKFSCTQKEQGMVVTRIK